MRWPKVRFFTTLVLDAYRKRSLTLQETVVVLRLRRGIPYPKDGNPERCCGLAFNYAGVSPLGIAWPLSASNRCS